MSADRNLIRIGQVLKTNGTEGEVVMGFRDIDLDDIDFQEPVFICYDGTPVPFFIDSLVPRGTGKALVRLTDIGSSDDADEIKGQAVYMMPESIGESAEDEDDMSFLEGWTLYDIHHTPDTEHYQGDDSTSAGTGRSGETNPDNDASGKGRTENQGDDAPSKGQTGNQDRRGHGNRIPENHCTENLTEIGKITGFLDIPGNPCIEVATENGAITIPLHEDLIVSIDPDTETIVMDIPAGLL